MRCAGGVVGKNPGSSVPLLCPPDQPASQMFTEETGLRLFLFLIFRLCLPQPVLPIPQWPLFKQRQQEMFLKCALKNTVLLRCSFYSQFRQTLIHKE